MSNMYWLMVIIICFCVSPTAGLIAMGLYVVNYITGLARDLYLTTRNRGK